MIDVGNNLGFAILLLAALLGAAAVRWAGRPPAARTDPKVVELLSQSIADTAKAQARIDDLENRLRVYQTVNLNGAKPAEPERVRT